MDASVLWGVVLTLAVLGILGAWFFWCGRADETRRVHAFAKRTLIWAGCGFVVGIAFLTSDLGNTPPEERLGVVALTVCCFLLLYASVSAMVASNDQSLVLVNLTGRPLLLSDPEFAPFYTLPAAQDQPADLLPPIRPRTCYVVSPELASLGAQAGRIDLYTVDTRTSTDYGDHRPLRVQHLLRAASAPTLSQPVESPSSVT